MNSQNIDDKTLMQNILANVKGACDLYMHGTVESSTPEVHSAFDDVLNQTLCMQNDISQKISSKGWYPTDQAEQQKVQKTKQQYSSFI